MQDKRSGLLGVMARVCVLIQQGVYTPIGGVNKSLLLVRIKFAYQKTF